MNAPLRPLLLSVLAACAVLLPAPAARAQGSTAPASKPAPTMQLSRDVDTSLRWLRASQDVETGAYGASVDTTAWVLRAMIQSHRRYQRTDGPFVSRALEFLAARQRPDGAICDADAKDAAVLEQTRVAAAALALHADATTKATLGRALGFLEEASDETPPWADVELPDSKEELAARVTELLARRGADGAWEGPRGKVAETAHNVVVLIRAAPALEPPPPPPGEVKPLPAPAPADAAKVAAAVERGARYLLAQSKDGRFDGAPGRPDAGLTAMAVSALQALPAPRPADVQRAIDQGLAWLASLQKEDGSIHDGRTANYTTSAAILALVRGGKPEHKAVIQKAQAWLVALQVGEEEGYSPDDPYYGGIGYGSGERPDLSNLQFALEALNASGLPKDHEAFQRALKFLQRCQNRSESNDIQIPDGGSTVVSGDDGGAGYLPGQSYAGYIELEGGRKVPRSYGSMTYALLKGFIFAGVPKDDPRMKAVWQWVRANWTLDVNPGFQAGPDPTAAYQGLYYYFHTLAKALDLYGETTIVDPQGQAHDWRAELSGRLLGLQRKTDGAWTNENSPRWYEGNPVLATSYALLTLELARPR